MNTRLLLTCAALCCALFGSACNVLNCVDGNNESTSQTRELSAFHGIVVDGSMDIVLTQGPVQSVRVEAESNIAELITTIVTGGVLTIDNSKCYSANKPVTVFVTIPEISLLSINGSGTIRSTTPIQAGSLSLEIAGSGDIVLDNLNAGAITTSIDGSGDIRLTGKAQSHSIVINGSGDIHALDLTIDRCTITINGSGDVRVHVTTDLTVQIAGSGDVFYRGNPQTHVTRSGSGNVSRL